LTKIYVLDTNVLLHNPSAIFVFEDNKVIIPEAVLEELNQFKWEKNERGANARMVSRLLDELRSNGRLDQGVSLVNGGILQVELNHYDTKMPSSWDMKEKDNRIIQVCKGLAEAHQDTKVIFVSKDVLLRVKAEAIGVAAQDFTNDKVPQADSYLGREEVFVKGELLTNFYHLVGGMLPKNELYHFTPEGRSVRARLEINQFLLVTAMENERQTALARFDGQDVVSFKYYHEGRCVCGIKPKSIGQKFLLEALMAPAEIAPLVICKGPAGTGKTLLALAAGLKEVMEGTGQYRRVLVLRPNATMDEDIGFLPGDERAKIDPLMRPVYDNLEIILDNDDRQRYANEQALQDKIKEIFERRYIITESIGYMRGRSVARHFVIIDEAQNLSPKQVKSIITRAGSGTKLVLLGDPDQIDRPFLDSMSNGLSYASERMKGSSYCWQVTLFGEESERSFLAKEGASRL
jgi:PhoH-like ATPase